MTTRYFATLTYDWDTTNSSGLRSYDNNQAEKLKCALVQLGWSWTETSAFVIDTADPTLVWRGIELFIKATPSIGAPTAVHYNVHMITDARPPTSMKNHPSAQTQIEGLPLPR